MKKLVLTSVCALAMSGAAFAQGSVEWNAITPTYFTAVTNTTTSSYLSSGGSASLQGGTSGSTVAAANSFYYELLYTAAGTLAPTSLTALKSWSDSGLEAVNNSASAGKTTTIGGALNSSVPFTTSESVMLVGWSADLGTTWSAAEASLSNDSWTGVALFGQSAVGTITPAPNGQSPGAVLFGPSPEISSPNTPLYEVVVPEPTTLALGALGGLSLLAFRRKKA